MNVSQGPQVSSQSPHPHPPLWGECHKLCRPDADEMKDTWVPTHPSQAAGILRISGLDGKFQFQPGTRSFHSGTPKDSGLGWDALGLDGGKFTSHRTCLSFLHSVREGREGREGYSWLFRKIKNLSALL